MGPSGVFDQSIKRISLPISPLLLSQSTGIDFPVSLIPFLLPETENGLLVIGLDSFQG
ncbi:hypothetical protein H6F89_31970 [Cyanobacteria bacterium FACHB-63]|nr:hypothetical protein [Cyanobacteria bacterium FACHB-63]